MSTEGLLLSLGLLAVTVLLVFMPIIGRRQRVDAATLAQQKRREELLVRYERALTSIRDLDADYEMGKIQPDDYEAERTRWSEIGVETLQALDALQPDQKILKDDDEIDEAIEEAVRGYVNQVGVT